jgi:hypothetical protein
MLSNLFNIQANKHNGLFISFTAKEDETNVLLDMVTKKILIDMKYNQIVKSFKDHDGGYTVMGMREYSEQELILELKSRLLKIWSRKEK